MGEKKSFQYSGLQIFTQATWAFIVVRFSLVCFINDYVLLLTFSGYLFVISHDLQKRVVDKEQEKQKIMEDTKELTEKNVKISQEIEKMNQELKNVEK